MPATLTAASAAQIVELLNAVYCLAELTEFAAFIWLRIKAPDLYRPYRVPLPTWACALMLLPATLLLLTILALPIINLDWQVTPALNTGKKGICLSTSMEDLACSLYSSCTGPAP